MTPRKEFASRPLTYGRTTYYTKGSMVACLKKCDYSYGLAFPSPAVHLTIYLEQPDQQYPLPKLHPPGGYSPVFSVVCKKAALVACTFYTGYP